MKRKKLLKLIALLMIVTNSASMVSCGRKKEAQTNEITLSVAAQPIKWNFENSNEGWGYEGAWEYHGTEEVSYDSQMEALKLGVDYTNDTGAGWSEFKIKTDFNNPAPIGEYNTAAFDFIYNPASMTQGGFKAKLFIPDGPSIDTDIDLSDAEDIGNGLKKKKVSLSFLPYNVNASSVTIGIVGCNTDYKGNIYVDNIKISKEDKINEIKKWTFKDSEENWYYEGSWDYKGPEGIAYSPEMQALKLNLDFTPTAESGWSEFKIASPLNPEESFGQYNLVKYDFIYNPANMTKGSFKAKLFVNEGPSLDVDIDLSQAEDYKNGYKKAEVLITFPAAFINPSSFTLGIVGSNTDYKGDIYIDNVVLGEIKSGDVYVEKTAVPKKQQKVTPESIQQYIPKTVKLVDDKADFNTAKLYAYLIGMGQTENVIYGHENDLHHKAVLKNRGTVSDTKDITGSIAGMMGIDTLSLTGDELSLTEEEQNKSTTLIKKAAKLGIDAYEEGAITTLSAHMPNFEIVVSKGKDYKGKYDYSGYTPNITSGNIVTRVMPGGDLNEAFTGYLDLIADYAKEMKDKDGNQIPVLFRPFHENNGSWFWWGASFCDAQSYKNLFAYTVDYLKNEKGVHNFLYVYSPNGPFTNEEDYLSRYPGDEYIDVIAFDMYHDDPLADPNQDPWMKSFKETVDLVQGIADKKGKLSAASETGIRVNGTNLPITGNSNKNWFSDVSKILSDSHMPYYMVWANFNNTDNFFAPFMIDETRGHEMINEFIDYYNEDSSVFADGMGNYKNISVEIEKNGVSGYITSPVSQNRILSQVQLYGVVRGGNADCAEVKYVLRNKQGDEIASIPAYRSGEEYYADLLPSVLAKAGKTTGTIELVVDGKVVNSIKAIFNIPEPEKLPEVVDNFENYLGDENLLLGEWGTNVGPGCNVTPKLSSENKYQGEYGLDFNYTISNEKTSEGWAGVIKDLGGVNWSDYNALQVWCRPDGKGQKLVIQLVSNGEDFEVRMPEFAATTEPQLLTIPFNKFVGKNGGTLDLNKIEKMGIWCNTLPPEGHEGVWTVESDMYFDDIKAVKTGE